MVYALKVEKKNAEKIRKKLVKKRLLSSNWNIRDNGKFIYFPLKEYVEGAIDIELNSRRRKKSPYERIIEKLKKLDMGKNVKVPDYWEKIGEVILLPPFTESEKIEKIVGKVFAEVLNAKTVCINHGIKGEFREPEIKVIYGEDTETLHTENGIKYKLDVAKIMFSSGNVDERIRMSKINVEGEIIVDMFSGIGYFTLPLAIYGRAKRIYACEKNPTAYYYLIDNVRINNVKNVIPLFGDNRRVCPTKIANRIIMGYIHTEKFIDLGIRILTNEGGTIHYHDLFKKEEIDYMPERNIKKHAEKYGFSVKILKKRIVKSYAPRIYHIVLDVELKKY